MIMYDGMTFIILYIWSYDHEPTLLEAYIYIYMYITLYNSIYVYMTQGIDRKIKSSANELSDSA